MALSVEIDNHEWDESLKQLFAESFKKEALSVAEREVREGKLTALRKPACESATNSPSAVLYEEQDNKISIIP